MNFDLKSFLAGRHVSSERDDLRAALVASEARVAELQGQMDMRFAEPHFVSDYVALVQKLIREHPLDEAMEIAIGGSYEVAGRSLLRILQACGLKDGMSVLDLGCGSGRVAHKLGLTFKHLDYTGIDIVQELLDYAKSKTPADYRFILHRELSLPVPDGSIDMFFAFSVFTHLLHEESFIYLADAWRAVKPGGSVVFSFLETRTNWPIFEGAISDSRHNAKKVHLNIVNERSQLQVWAERIGFVIESMDIGGPHEGHGQSVAHFRKPA